MDFIEKKYFLLYNMQKKKEGNMEKEIKLENDERIDDLEYKELKIIQKVNGFCFGIDAVVLSDFAKDIKKDCFSVCIVARKHPSKGLITFINAYNQLPNNYKKRITDIKLISHDDLSDYNTKGMNIIKPRSDNEIAKIFLNSNEVYTNIFN